MSKRLRLKRPTFILVLTLCTSGLIPGLRFSLAWHKPGIGPVHGAIWQPYSTGIDIDLPAWYALVIYYDTSVGLQWWKLSFENIFFSNMIKKVVFRCMAQGKSTLKQSLIIFAFPLRCVYRLISQYHGGCQLKRFQIFNHLKYYR